MIETYVAENAPRLLKNKTPMSLALGIIQGGESRFFASGETSSKTLYEIGSISKVFTALLLAEMLQRGEVYLEQPVNDFFPEIQPVVSLKALATHTSGLGRLPKGILGSVLKNSRNPYANYGRAEFMKDLREVRAKDLKTAGLIAYSNWGMGLLGEALAKRLGLSYEAAIRQRISEPLGMLDTCVVPNEAQSQRLAPALDAGGKPAEAMVIPSLGGAGALRSTVDDLLLFLCAHLEPKKDFIAQSLQLTYRDFAPIGGFLGALGWLIQKFQGQQEQEIQEQGIGLGWLSVRLLKSGRSAWMHNGGTMGFRSFMAFVPESQTAIVGLLNRGASELEVFIPRYSIDKFCVELLEKMES